MKQRQKCIPKTRFKARTGNESHQQAGDKQTGKVGACPSSTLGVPGHSCDYSKNFQEFYYSKPTNMTSAATWTSEPASC